MADGTYGRDIVANQSATPNFCRAADDAIAAMEREIENLQATFPEVFNGSLDYEVQTIRDAVEALKKSVISKMQLLTKAHGVDIPEIKVKPLEGSLASSFDTIIPLASGEQKKAISGAMIRAAVQSLKI